MQSGKDHYLFVVNGEQSDQLGRQLLKLDGLRTTRIDLQLTLPCPEDYSSREYYDTIENGRWLGLQGRTPQPELIQSPKGHCEFCFSNKYIAHTAEHSFQGRIV